MWVFLDHFPRGPKPHPTSQNTVSISFISRSVEQTTWQCKVFSLCFLRHDRIQMVILVLHMISNRFKMIKMRNTVQTLISTYRYEYSINISYAIVIIFGRFPKIITRSHRKTKLLIFYYHFYVPFPGGFLSLMVFCQHSINHYTHFTEMPNAFICGIN